MAGPWEQYAQPSQSEAPASGPWSQYAQQEQPRSAMDKLLGIGGERYQTWPEVAARSAFSLPQRMIEGAARSQPGNREDTERNLIPLTTEAAMTFGPLPAAMRAGERAIPGVAKNFKAEAPVVPTAQELKAAGIADINAGRDSSLNISSQAVSDYSKKIQQELFDRGFHPTGADSTYKVLRELENAPSGSSFTPANLQTLRESLSGIAQNFNPNFAKDQSAASAAIKRIDEFLANVSPKDTVVGATSAAPGTQEQLVARALEGKREAGRLAEIIARGRGNYAAAQRANDITGTLDRATTGILERAEGRAQTANSGRNLDNTIRSKAESLLEKPKDVSGFNDAELSAIEHVRDGGAVRNTARYVGNLLGGGGGIGQSGIAAVGAGMGGAAGGIPGAIVGGIAPAVAGAGSKSLANYLAKRDLAAVDKMIRMRSPMYQDRVANPNMIPDEYAKAAALARILMGDRVRQVAQ